jgi:Ni/Fe-hydrogenase 1 B-type cytochrome subunit
MQANRIRVYAWEFPVRFTHWINALCLIVFCITGYYIGSPYLYAVTTQQYVMGWMRFLHFVTAYAFLMSMIIRIYWMFAGNQYAGWRVFLPFTRRQRDDFMTGLKFYLFLEKKPPYAVGHSAVAGVTYFGMFLMFIFEIVSGFALYSQGHAKSIFISYLGGWLLRVLHVQTIRLWHHLVMYVLIAFTIIHVYIGWYLDSVEKNGVMGSIFGGYKFVTGKEWE